MKKLINKGDIDLELCYTIIDTVTHCEAILQSEMERIHRKVIS